MRGRFTTITLTALLALTALVLLLTALQARPAAGAGEPPAYAPGRLILKLQQTPPQSPSTGRTGFPSLDALLAAHGVQAMEPLFSPVPSRRDLAAQLGLERIYVAYLAAGNDPRTAATTLTADPHVAYAEPDYTGSGALFPNDSGFALQWALHNTGQTGGQPGADVDAPAAWDLTTGSSDVRLAILDTGIDLDHPDLAAKILPGYDYVNNDPVAQDDHGHGTHVAGIAAASSNNSVGVAGVCWACRLMPVKVLNDQNWGFYTWWAAGIIFAVDQGAHVINMSMGGTDPSNLLFDAVRYAYLADVPVVAAMMNTGNSTPFIPAAFADSIAVGATDHTDTRSGYSNFGNHIDLIAPGTNIFSTMLDNTYESWVGTSMAVAHVAGTFGLLLSLDPTLTVEELRAAVRLTADDQVGPPAEDTPGWDIYYGSGRLNSGRAVATAANAIPTAVTISGPTRGLTNTTYTFTALVQPPTAATPITYTWEAGGQSEVVNVGGITGTVAFSWNVTGTYVLTTTADNGFGVVRDTYLFNVTPPIPPQADFSASTTSGPVPLPVIFNNLTTGDYAAVLWDFGDGVTSTLSSPVHTYLTPGVYTVTLSVSGPYGNSTLMKPDYIQANPGQPLYLPILSRPE